MLISTVLTIHAQKAIKKRLYQKSILIKAYKIIFGLRDLCVKSFRPQWLIFTTVGTEILHKDAQSYHSLKYNFALQCLILL